MTNGWNPQYAHNLKISSVACSKPSSLFIHYKSRAAILPLSIGQDHTHYYELEGTIHQTFFFFCENNTSNLTPMVGNIVIDYVQCLALPMCQTGIVYISIASHALLFLGFPPEM